MGTYIFTHLRIYILSVIHISLVRTRYKDAFNDNYFLRNVSRDVRKVFFAFFMLSVFFFFVLRDFYLYL